MDFYNLLYRGYTGEYQLVSSLYRNGLDAVRPPADMGVDVVSLNLKAQLENPQAAPETFFFQVKTASTPINDASMSNGLRALTTVQFKLKESEVDLLGKSSDRALVCYVYSNDNDALTDATEAPFLYFWLDGTRIENIRRAGAFFQQPGEAKLTLSCQLRKPASEAGHWYAVIVDKHGRQVEEGYLGTVDGDNEHTLASDRPTTTASRATLISHVECVEASSPAKPSAHARAAMQQAPAPKTPLATFGVPTSKPPSVGLRPLRNERAQTTIPRSANACAIRPSPTYPRPTANQSPLVPLPS